MFYREIELATRVIEAHVEDLKALIERNVATEENPNGPLTLNFFDYTDCLNINSKKLLQRIQSDMDYWKAHIASIGQEKEKFINKIDEFMKRQSQEL